MTGRMNIIKPMEQAHVRQKVFSSHSKPLGTIQIDVDDLWVYYESIHRVPPANLPAQVYEQGIARLLDLFARFAVRATFFVCGRDLPVQAHWLREMVRHGHEIANHSTWHRTGFARLSAAEKRADIVTTQVLIEEACGQRPSGFKAPGFSFAPDLLAVLAELGFCYDSTILPMPWAPALRSLQRLLSHGEVDGSHYGRARHGLAPLHPYQPDMAAPHRPRPADQPGQPDFWEAPVTTMPLLRLPMHSTFVLTAGQPLFDAGMMLVQTKGVPVNYLLHAADVIDAVDDPALASYRFLTTAWSEKRPLYEHMLHSLSEQYEIVPTRELIERLATAGQRRKK